MTGIGAAYFYLPPPFSLRLNDWSTATRLLEFVAVCLLVSFLNEARRRSQRRAETARAEAEAANRIKDDFLAMISHELRTPLSAILGWTQVLRADGARETTCAQALEGIERSARIESRLVEDLLDISRVSLGQLRLNVTRVDVAGVIQASLDAIRPALDAKNLDLRATLGLGSAFVNGDAQRLQQVMWNLLSNAAKFTPEDGRIDVLLERSDSHVRIVISDTGEGIDPAFLPYVFDRFRQGDVSAQRHGGLGLGLAIARHLVDLHGGRLRAASGGLGRGATFTVELPTAAEHANAAAA